MKLNEMVEIEFKENYIAARGQNISGVKGAVKSIRVTEQLKELIAAGTVAVVKGTAASKRSKAAGRKKGAEKS